MAEYLCPTCENSIRCDTWAEWRCKVKEKRIYDYKEMKTCLDYKRRGKDFKEPRCECENCLENDLLYEED